MALTAKQWLTRWNVLRAMLLGAVMTHEIMEFTGYARSTVQRSLSLLRDAGLIEQRGRGNWAWWWLTESGLSQIASIGNATPAVLESFEHYHHRRMDVRRSTARLHARKGRHVKTVP